MRLTLENNVKLVVNTFHQGMNQLAPILVVSELHKTLVPISPVHTCL